MNLVIPMAWEWTRFQWKQAKKILENYDIWWLWKIPKPYLNINWKTMIEHVLDWLNIDWNKYLIVNNLHLEDQEVKNIIDNIKRKYKNIFIIEDESNLEWPAKTVMSAKKHINDKSLLILNSDQFFATDFSSKFINHISKNYNDWTIITYDNTELKNSFAILDENWKVIKVVEKPKQYIKNSLATTWLYYWKNWKVFLEWAEEMFNDNTKKVNWEFYIAPIYNENIKQWYNFDTLNSEDIFLVWTPNDLENYLKNFY